MIEQQGMIGAVPAGPAKSPTSRNVLVLGLGNPLRGDDGIGPRIIEKLIDCGLPEGVAALDVGAGGLDLLRVMEGWDDVVIVDAADLDAGRGQIAPGEFVRFTLEQARLVESSYGLSLHGTGLAEVVRLARALGRPLPSIVIFGIQPEDIAWGEGLSTNVEATIPLLINAILEEVERITAAKAAATVTQCSPA